MCLGPGCASDDRLHPNSANPTGLVWLENLPRILKVTAGRQVQLKAVVHGSPNQEVLWGLEQANGAKVTPAGLFTAPTQPGAYALVCRAKGAPGIRDITVVMVFPAPEALALSASTARLGPGETATLTPEFRGGSAVVVPDVGAVTSGQPFPVRPGADTRYTLRVTNEAGDVAETSITVAVGANHGGGPAANPNSGSTAESASLAGSTAAAESGGSAGSGSSAGGGSSAGPGATSGSTGSGSTAGSGGSGGSGSTAGSGGSPDSASTASSSGSTGSVSTAGSSVSTGSGSTAGSGGSAGSASTAGSGGSTGSASAAGSGSNGSAGSGSTAGSGGSTGSGSTASSGGSTGSGSTAGSGGSTGSGSTAGSGGSTGSSSTAGSGGSTGSGSTAGSGGSTGSGSTAGSGGSTGSGSTASSGGSGGSGSGRSTGSGSASGSGRSGGSGSTGRTGSSAGSGSTAPAGPLVFTLFSSTARSGLTPPGTAVDLFWRRTGTVPTELTLSNNLTDQVETITPPSRNQVRVAAVRRRQTFELVGRYPDPATGATLRSSIRTTVAAQGVDLLAGDGTHARKGYRSGPLATAAWRHVSGLGCNGDDLFISEGRDSTIRKVQADGTVVPFAGVRGRPMAGAHDRPGGLVHPVAMVFSHGLMIVADADEHCLKTLQADGTGAMGLLAGAPGQPGAGDGTGPGAAFNTPWDLAVHADSGTVFVSDRGNRRVRMVSPLGVVTTLPFEFTDPAGLAVHPDGRVFVADAGRSVIEVLVPTLPLGPGSTWLRHHLAGVDDGHPGFHDGPGAGARFNRPRGLALGSGPLDGHLVVADEENHLIRRISLTTREVDTLAGDPADRTSGWVEGALRAARFNRPTRVAVNRQGQVLVADQGATALREIRPAEGAVATLGVSGATRSAGAVNAAGALARFKRPMGIAVDGHGSAWVAEPRNHAIRLVRPSGEVLTGAGQLGTAGDANGPADQARFQDPTEIGWHPASDRVLVLEPGAGRVRMLDNHQIVTTVLAGLAAPRCLAVFPGGDQPAFALGIRSTADPLAWDVIVERNGVRETVAIGVVPAALAARGTDHLEVLALEAGGYRLRRFGQPGGPGAPWQALGDAPVDPGPLMAVPDLQGMALDPEGNALFADLANGMVWRLDRASNELSAVAGHYPALAPTSGPAALGEPIYQPRRLAFTAAGDLLLTAGNAVVQITAPDPTVHARGWQRPAAPEPAAGSGSGIPDAPPMDSGIPDAPPMNGPDAATGGHPPPPPDPAPPDPQAGQARRGWAPPPPDPAQAAGSAAAAILRNAMDTRRVVIDDDSDDEATDDADSDFD